MHHTLVDSYDHGSDPPSPAAATSQSSYPATAPEAPSTIATSSQLIEPLQPSYLLGLPAELIWEIADHLPLATDLGHFRLTCKKVEPTVVREFALRYFSHLGLGLTSRGLDWLSEVVQCPRLVRAMRSLVIQVGPLDEDDALNDVEDRPHLHAALTRATKLESLWLIKTGPNPPDVHWLLPTVISALNASNISLDTFWVWKINMGTNPDGVALTPGLRELNCLPNLRNVVVCVNTHDGYNPSFDISCVVDAISRAHMLKDLSLHAPTMMPAIRHLADRTLSRISSDRLSQISIDRLRLGAQPLLAVLRQNRQLERVTLVNCWLTEGSWRDILIFFRDRLRHLRHLVFFNNRVPDDLMACTIWDGRPILALYDNEWAGDLFEFPPARDDGLSDEGYVWVEVQEQDDGTMLESVAEEKGLRDALDDMVAGYCERGYVSHEAFFQAAGLL